MLELRREGVLTGIHWAVYAVVVDRCATWDRYEVPMSAAAVASEVHGRPITKGRRYDEVAAALAELAEWGAIHWQPGRGARSAELGVPTAGIPLSVLSAMDVDNVADQPPRGGVFGIEGGEGCSDNPPGEGYSDNPPGEGCSILTQPALPLRQTNTPCAHPDELERVEPDPVVLDFIASAKRALASEYVPPALRHLNRSERHATG
jgi:hypothetical protein